MKATVAEVRQMKALEMLVEKVDALVVEVSELKAKIETLQAEKPKPKKQGEGE